jgi:putative ABC transport system substrate-binding protein
MTTRRKVLIALGAGALAAPLGGLAQARARMWRIGFLAPGSPSTRIYEGFREGMRELGYVEGRGFTIDWRFADGDYGRLPRLAAELVLAKPDVIVAGTTQGVQAARAATTRIPIVMVEVPDPIGEGFATSLPRPGKNITGLSDIVTELSVKHLELLRSSVPKLSVLAVLINPLNASDTLILEQINGAAYSTGVKVVTVEASTATQIDAGFAAVARARADGMIVAADTYFDLRRRQVARLAIQNRLPLISADRDLTEAGGLMSYGQDLLEHYRDAASYVDKIVQGAKPGELPIEQPTVIELVINRRTALALGLALPQELLLRANTVLG